jgi:hypothetical protein
MQRKILLFILILFLPFLSHASELHFGGKIGFRSGLSFQADATLSKLAKGFPFQIRGSAAYTSLDPGKPLAARRVFINNATNGTPEETSWMWDVRLDMLYPVKWFSLKEAYFFAGPRYSWFTGRFDFVGGNEDFDIYCDSWGLGAGLESHYSISKKVDLVLSAGLDYFITDYLHGHDTTYSSDGEIVNGRENYTYDDADEAINQPTFVPSFTIGVNYFFD